jgi:hypothetical protein
MGMQVSFRIPITPIVVLISRKGRRATQLLLSNIGTISA